MICIGLHYALLNVTKNMVEHNLPWRRFPFSIDNTWPSLQDFINLPDHFEDIVVCMQNFANKGKPFSVTLIGFICWSNLHMSNKLIFLKIKWFKTLEWIKIPTQQASICAINPFHLGLLEILFTLKSQKCQVMKDSIILMWWFTMTGL